MTSSLSANGRTCSLEMLVGVVERVMAQEMQLQDAIKQIASIKSTLVGFKTDMKSTSAADGGELAGSLVGMIHDLRRELYVEIDEIKTLLSMRNAASVPVADKEEFPKPGRTETLGTHEGKDAISEERVELSEHLVDVTAEQTKANVSGVHEQFQEQQDLHSELHRLNDQVCVLRQQLAKIDMSKEEEQHQRFKELNEDMIRLQQEVRNNNQLAMDQLTLSPIAVPGADNARAEETEATRLGGDFLEEAYGGGGGAYGGAYAVGEVEKERMEEAEAKIQALEERLKAEQKEKDALKAAEQHVNNAAQAQQEQLVSMKGSAWEIVAFVAAPQISNAASAVIVISILLNAMLQLFFCGAASLSLTSNEMDAESQEEYKQWRFIAHRLESPESLSRTTGETLVKRLCDLDGSLSTATQQYIIKQQIDSYLARSVETAHMPAGILLCMLALMIWYLSLASECIGMWDYLKVVHSVPSGRFEVKFMDDGTLQLLFLSGPRKIACLIVTLARLFVAGSLAYIGTKSTVYTNSVSELMLNALSFEMVLQLDEYLFDTIIPMHVKELVNSLRPFQVPRTPEVLGIGRRAFFSLVLVPAGLFAAYVTLVMPHTEDLRAVDEILCSGDHHFVYATDMSGFPHAINGFRSRSVDGTTKNAISPSKIAQWENDAVTVAVFEDVSQALANNMMVWEKDVRGLEFIVAARELDTLFESFQNTSCQDLLTFGVCEQMHHCPTNAAASFQRFATLFKKTPITSCNQFIEAGGCTSFDPPFPSLATEAVLTRNFCPEACGCSLNPPSPFRTFSCPQSCRVTLNSRVECTDFPAQHMQSLQQLQYLRKDFQSISEAKSILTLVEDLMILGCDLVAVWQDPYSNDTAPLPACSRHTSAANLTSCLTVRCQDYDQTFCQHEVQNNTSCQSLVMRPNLPDDFGFTHGDTGLKLSKICPWTCKTCLELPHCMFPYRESDASKRMDEQDFRPIFYKVELELNWRSLLRGICPSTCHCNRMPADDCPSSCSPACDETLRGTDGVDYRGCQMITRTQKLCQRWTAQTPSAHSKDLSLMGGNGDHNYCRNPDGSITIWCYTLDVRTRWEWCDPLLRSI